MRYVAVVDRQVVAASARKDARDARERLACDRARHRGRARQGACHVIGRCVSVVARDARGRHVRDHVRRRGRARQDARHARERRARVVAHRGAAQRVVLVFGTRAARVPIEVPAVGQAEPRAVLMLGARAARVRVEVLAVRQAEPRAVLVLDIRAARVRVGHPAARQVTVVLDRGGRVAARRRVDGGGVVRIVGCRCR